MPLPYFTHRWWTPLLTALRAALSVLIDERCPMCGRSEFKGEICPSCWFNIPYTHLRGASGNVLERLFWSEPMVQRVSAYAWYKPEYAISKVVHEFKYYGRKDLAQLMGEAMGRELLDSDFFEGVDVLVPVPLSAQRLRKRGYNQSEHLAKGVAQATGLPLLTTAIARVVDNPSQTTLDPSQRQDNVRDIFAVVDADALAGRNIVVIDDVITVGATLLSLLQTLRPVPHLRVSLLALCAAGRYHVGRLSPDELHLSDATADAQDHVVRKYHKP